MLVDEKVPDPVKKEDQLELCVRVRAQPANALCFGCLRHYSEVQQGVHKDHTVIIERMLKNKSTVARM